MNEFFTTIIEVIELFEPLKDNFIDIFKDIKKNINMINQFSMHL